MKNLIIILIFGSLLVAAAGCANPSSSPTTQIHPPDKRVLDKVPNMWTYDDPRFGIAKEFVQNEQVRCLAISLWLQGYEKIDYPLIMVVSCAAANFHYNPNEKFWCYMVSPDPVDRRFLKRTGFKYNFIQPDLPEEAYDFIKRHITAGRAVVGSWYSTLLFYGFDESQEEPVLYYYNMPFAENGAKWAMPEFVKDYWGAPVPKELIAVTEKFADIDYAHEVQYALKRIVQCAKQNLLLKSSFPEGYDVSDIATGFKAYEAYAADLDDMSKKLNKSYDDKTGYFDIGWSCYAIYPQWTARASTAVFLRKYAAKYIPDKTLLEHLAKAADYYDLEIQSWKEWEKHLGRNLELYASSPEKAMTDLQKRWNDPARRKAGAAAVREALKWERLAVAEVEKTLRHSVPEE
jgi:hypothetical protein